MSRLPSDVDRCGGRPAPGPRLRLADECQQCRRYTEYDDARSWTDAPDADPCPLRIAPLPSTDQARR